MLTEISPIEHFKELISSAIRHQKIKTHPVAESYLSSLLASYTLNERHASEPLAIKYLKALSAGREVQARMLKELGDASLFTTGFFSDSLKKSVVDVDYYMSMGVSSYSYLAALHREEGSATPLFAELARKFNAFVDVLTEVSERSRLTSSSDILRVYERWIKTHSKHSERILRESGIEPHMVTTKHLH